MWRPSVQRVLDKYRELWALGYAMALMGWDSETYMPEGAAKERGEAEATLVLIRRRKLLSMAPLVYRMRPGNDEERGMKRELLRSIRYHRRVPREVVEELAKVTNEAKVVWRRAKEKSDFSMFRPYLERIVELNRKKAEALGYENHPYDALLDLYEEGFTVKDADRMFSELKGIGKLVKGVRAESPLENEEYEKESMETLNREILRELGFQEEYQRMDVSAHPFTESIGLYDVRITTWYHGKDFRRSLLAAVHEFGHSIYERGVDEKYWMTPVQGGVSMGIHESQSRFYENIVGRSREFVEHFFPLMRKHLPFLEKYTVDDVYLYFNLVRPDYIRVEADEATYNLHILIRYEIEKGLIDESVSVEEVPQVWWDMVEKYLGLEPREEKYGCLQDIHWSLGYFGYFPTYTIGTVLAAQIAHHMDPWDRIREGRFGEIREWLKERIHRWGSVYPPKELVKRALGEEINPEYFVERVRGIVKLFS